MGVAGMLLRQAQPSSVDSPCHEVYIKHPNWVGPVNTDLSSFLYLCVFETDHGQWTFQTSCNCFNRGSCGSTSNTRFTTHNAPTANMVVGDLLDVGPLPEIWCLCLLWIPELDTFEEGRQDDLGLWYFQTNPYYIYLHLRKAAFLQRFQGKLFFIQNAITFGRERFSNNCMSVRNG